VFFSMAFVFLISCSKDKVLENHNEAIGSFAQPDHFPAAHYDFSRNPYSTKGFNLGKRLFFDPILSDDSSVSCSSCHHQEYAFSDAGNQFSEGINGGVVPKNVPPIFNMAWNERFMWDGGITHLDFVPFAPIINPLEMGSELIEVIAKLNRSKSYKQEFKQVFGKDSIDDQQLFFAFSQYMANLVSYQSDYDGYLNGKKQLKPEALRGLDIFRAHCASCHQEPLFRNHDFHNNGIDQENELDEGRFRITQDQQDYGKFKTPSLRNIALTYPYMHDGRFQSLEEVIEHYSSGIKDSNNLDASLKSTEGGFQFSEAEKQDLLAFLETLTDNKFISDPNLSE